jgi:hypothetical protein
VGRRRHARSAAARQVTAWAARTAKDRAVDPAALRPWWRERLHEVDFESTALDRTMGRASTVSFTDATKPGYSNGWPAPAV